jgi:hypothetical protein
MAVTKNFPISLKDNRSLLFLVSHFEHKRCFKKTINCGNNPAVSCVSTYLNGSRQNLNV